MRKCAYHLAVVLAYIKEYHTRGRTLTSISRQRVLVLVQNLLSMLIGCRFSSMKGWAILRTSCGALYVGAFLSSYHLSHENDDPELHL